MEARGFVLHETEDIAVIATMHSENVKTGDMVQVWILYRHESPWDAVHSGHDSAVCFDCGHRGPKRTCYVDLSRAPLQVWKSYRRHAYPYAYHQEFERIFAGRKVRFGAYGEPVLIPLWIVERISAVADGWTGYTHQWRRPEYQDYRAYVMASCDSERDATDASANGWRTFRMRTEAQGLLPREITCPASNEAGHRTTCAKCGLCNGRRDNDPRANIAILVHGVGARNFQRLIQIGGIA